MFGIFLLAFCASCGMIARFMSSEKPLPQQTQGAQREADVYDLLAWFETNKKKVLVVALVLVAAGFVIATMRYLREQKEANASAQLLSLKATLNPATNAVPPQPAAFLKVAQEFKGTGAAERARLLAGTAYFTEGKYSEAEAEFSAFMKEFSDSPWIATAAYGIASAQEAQNKAEAVASYQNVATAYANSVVADDAKLALARIHEAKNQPDQALRLYNELLTAKPGEQAGGPAHSEAFARKEALLRAHPELGTNQVGVVPPAPAASDIIRIPSATNVPAATGATTTPTP